MSLIKEQLNQIIQNIEKPSFIVLLYCQHNSMASAFIHQRVQKISLHSHVHSNQQIQFNNIQIQKCFAKNLALFQQFKQGVLNYGQYYQNQFYKSIRPLRNQVKYLEEVLTKQQQYLNAKSLLMLADYTIHKSKLSTSIFQEKLTKLQKNCLNLEKIITQKKQQQSNLNHQYNDLIKELTKLKKQEVNLKNSSNQLINKITENNNMSKNQQKQSKKQRGKSHNQSQKYRKHSQHNLTNKNNRVDSQIQKSCQYRTKAFHSIHKNYIQLEKIERIKEQLNAYVKFNQKKGIFKCASNIDTLLNTISYKVQKINKIQYIQEDNKKQNDLIILSDYENMLKFQQLEKAKQVIYSLSSQDILTILIKQKKVSEINFMIQKQKNPYIYSIEKLKHQNIHQKQSLHQRKTNIPKIFYKKRQNLLKL